MNQAPGARDEWGSLALGFVLGLVVLLPGSVAVGLALFLAAVGAPVLAVVAAWLLLRRARGSAPPRASPLRAVESPPEPTLERCGSSSLPTPT